MCNEDFFFQGTGFQYEAETQSGHETRYLVSPRILIPHVLLKSCLPANDVYASQKANAALKDVMCSDADEGSCTAMLVMAVVPSAFRFADVLFSRLLCVYAQSSRDHYTNALTNILLKPDDFVNYLHAVECSISSARVMDEPVMTDDNLAHPARTALVAALQASIMDLQTVVQQYANSCAALQGVPPNAGLSVLTGPTSIVPDVTVANESDSTNTHINIGTNAIPFMQVRSFARAERERLRRERENETQGEHTQREHSHILMRVDLYV
jgi:hypothetical protein